MEELEKLMNRYAEILDETRALKREKEDVKSQVLVFIKMNDITRHLSDDGVILTHKEVTRRTVNKAKIEDYCADNNMEVEQFMSESVSERLTIKRIEKEEK